MDKPRVDQALTDISLQFNRNWEARYKEFTKGLPSISIEDLPEGLPVFHAQPCPRCESQQCVIRDGALLCTGCDQERTPCDSVHTYMRWW